MSFRTSDGRMWAHVTAARSSTHEAVREGWNFFQDSFWRGPKPIPETVFEISWSVMIGDGGSRRASALGVVHKTVHTPMFDLLGNVYRVGITRLESWRGEGDLFSPASLKTRKLYTFKRAENSESARNTKSSHTVSHTGVSEAA